MCWISVFVNTIYLYICHSLFTLTFSIHELLCVSLLHTFFARFRWKRSQVLVEMWEEGRWIEESYIIYEFMVVLTKPPRQNYLLANLASSLSFSHQSLYSK